MVWSGQLRWWDYCGKLRMREMEELNVGELLTTESESESESERELRGFNFLMGKGRLQCVWETWKATSQHDCFLMHKNFTELLRSVWKMKSMVLDH